MEQAHLQTKVEIFKQVSTPVIEKFKEAIFQHPTLSEYSPQNYVLGLSPQPQDHFMVEFLPLGTFSRVVAAIKEGVVLELGLYPSQHSQTGGLTVETGVSLPSRPYVQRAVSENRLHNRVYPAGSYNNPPPQQRPLVSARRITPSYSTSHLPTFQVPPMSQIPPIRRPSFQNFSPGGLQPTGSSPYLSNGYNQGTPIRNVSAPVELSPRIQLPFSTSSDPSHGPPDHHHQPVNLSRPPMDQSPLLRNPSFHYRSSSLEPISLPLATPVPVRGAHSSPTTFLSPSIPTNPPTTDLQLSPRLKNPQFRESLKLSPSAVQAGLDQASYQFPSVNCRLDGQLPPNFLHSPSSHRLLPTRTPSLPPTTPGGGSFYAVPNRRAPGHNFEITQSSPYTFHPKTGNQPQLTRQQQQNQLLLVQQKIKQQQQPALSPRNGIGNKRMPDPSSLSAIGKEPTFGAIPTNPFPIGNNGVVGPVRDSQIIVTDDLEALDREFSTMLSTMPTKSPPSKSPPTTSPRATISISEPPTPGGTPRIDIYPSPNKLADVINPEGPRARMSSHRTQKKPPTSLSAPEPTRPLDFSLIDQDLDPVIVAKLSKSDVYSAEVEDMKQFLKKIQLDSSTESVPPTPKHSSREKKKHKEKSPRQRTNNINEGDINTLCQAAWDNEFELFASILAKNPKLVNQMSDKGQFPLYCAARKGRIEMVERLLEYPDVNINLQCTKHGGTAMHAASFYQYPEVLCILLWKGADPSITNFPGVTARDDARGSCIGVWTAFETESLEDMVIKYYPQLQSNESLNRIRIRKNLSSSRAEGLLERPLRSQSLGLNLSGKKRHFSKNLSQGQVFNRIEKEDENFVVHPSSNVATNNLVKLVDLLFGNYIHDSDVRFRVSQFSSRFSHLRERQIGSPLPIPQIRSNTLNHLKPLIATYPKYTIEPEVKDAPSDFLLEGTTTDKLWYSILFTSPHTNFIGVDKTNGPFILSILPEPKCPNIYFVIIRSTLGDLFDVVYSGNITEAFTSSISKRTRPVTSSQAVTILKTIYKQSLNENHLIQIFSKNIRMIKEPKLIQSLNDFEASESTKCYKFGILLAREGQLTEAEMFGNEHATPNFEEFLDLIGQRVSLAGFNQFSGGLDVSEKKSTGEKSIFVNWKSFQIMFHVSTFLPFSVCDTQHLSRKRHIGNDIVVCIFQDGNSTLLPDLVSSMFIHVVIVVQPIEIEGNKFYRISVSSKDPVGTFGPKIPTSGILTPGSLKDFLLTKMVNGERAACRGGQLLQTLKRARSSFLQETEKNFP